MPIKYIGRTTNTKGKPLWEILANLKNFGVGRMIIRSNVQRYPEPSYYRILKVGALPTPSGNVPGEVRKVMALVEKTFRGVKQSKPIQLDSTTYKADYILIPKDEEARYMSAVERPLNVLPSVFRPPPLLKEILKRQMEIAKVPIPDSLVIPMVYSSFKNKPCRLAEEGEVPPIDLVLNPLGKPASPTLYANIKKDMPTDSTSSNTQ